MRRDVFDFAGLHLGFRLWSEKWPSPSCTIAVRNTRGHVALEGYLSGSVKAV